MGLTHFPNGVSAQNTSAVNASAGTGDLDCVDLYASGALDVAGAVVGETVVVGHTFGSASTADVAPISPCITGTVVSTFITLGSVSALVAAYTVQVGTALTVA